MLISCSGNILYYVENGGLTDHRLLNIHIYITAFDMFWLNIVYIST